MSVIRVRDWRVHLFAWARDIRGQPFVWGETDCMSLAREALRLQFGRDVLPDIKPWDTVRKAHDCWKKIEDDGGLPSLFGHLGAREVSQRRYNWPVGSIVEMGKDEHGFVSVGVYVDPIIVSSTLEDGVHWIEGKTAIVNGAWLLEVWNG